MTAGLVWWQRQAAATKLAGLYVCLVTKWHRVPLSWSAECPQTQESVCT